MRQGGAQRQHADQLGKGGAGPLRHPADDQLHAQRVDPGQAETDREAQGNADRHAGREEGEGGIAEGAEDGADGEDAARRVTVGEAGNSEGQGAEDEAQLHCIGQGADVRGGDTPGANQVIGGAVGGKP